MMLKLPIVDFILYSNTVIGIILIIMLVFVCFNPVFNSRQTRAFCLALVIIIVAVVAISFDTILQFSKLPWGYHFRRFTSFLNFALSPFVPLLLLQIFSKKNLKFYMMLPAIFNAVICFISMFVKLVFFISAGNQYGRGLLFLMPFLTSVFYIVVLMCIQGNHYARSRISEQVFLIFSILLFVVSFILEIKFYFRFFAWNSAGVIFVMYYLLLNMHERITDSLTGQYNRVLYNSKIEKINKTTDCVISLMDVNNLKYINDTFGHDVGDQYLITFSKLLSQHLNSIATVFRIGGDEFFCISKKVKLSEFEVAVEKLQKDCLKKNFTFACGTLQYRKTNSVFEALKEVDRLMYKNKLIIKSKSKDNVVTTNLN